MGRSIFLTVFRSAADKVGLVGMHKRVDFVVNRDKIRRVSIFVFCQNTYSVILDICTLIKISIIDFSPWTNNDFLVYIDWMMMITCIVYVGLQSVQHSDLPR